MMLVSEVSPGLSVGLQQLVQFSVQSLVSLLNVVQTGVDLVQHGRWRCILSEQQHVYIISTHHSCVDIEPNAVRSRY